jgi:putative membrane protein
MPDNSNPNRARDHLANERTFLAWVRTGVATIVFGFAVGRFSIALREFMKMQGYNSTTPGLTTWLGIISTWVECCPGRSQAHRKKSAT